MTQASFGAADLMRFETLTVIFEGNSKQVSYRCQNDQDASLFPEKHHLSVLELQDIHEVERFIDRVRYVLLQLWIILLVALEQSVRVARSGCRNTS